MSPVFITGNLHKAKYFSEMVGIDIEHVKLELEELQTLDVARIVDHKARQAYDSLQRPVIVEDTFLTCIAMGRLPGPFIKFFLDEMGPEGVCQIMNGFADRSAVAGAMIAYYDGRTLEIFEKSLAGEIALKPTGTNGFGWNRIFIPHGINKTLGELSDAEFKKWYAKIKPFAEVSTFLKQLENE